MYKASKAGTTGLKVNTSVEGETIEMKVERIVNNKEPITDGAPLIFTERKDGVQPDYNIRTDRFEVAVDAMDVVDKTWKAKRKEKHEPKIVKMEGKDGNEGTSGNSGTSTKD